MHRSTHCLHSLLPASQDSWVQVQVCQFFTKSFLNIALVFDHPLQSLVLMLRIATYVFVPCLLLCFCPCIYARLMRTVILRNCTGPVSTYCAAVRLWTFELKIGTPVFPSLGNVHSSRQFWFFYSFSFSSLEPVRDRRTDRQADGRARLVVRLITCTTSP